MSHPVLACLAQLIAYQKSAYDAMRYTMHTLHNNGAPCEPVSHKPPPAGDVQTC